jgi:arylsulfatase A-like enzyme
MQTGHGHTLYDELLHVPLIFYNPKIFPRGRGIDYQVRLIDILPTILQYLGYTEERSFRGKSLKGMIEENDHMSRPAYSEATTYGTERESIRADGYKYIHRISYGQLSYPDSQGLPLTPLHEFYNLNADPDEKVNLAEKQKGMVEKYQKLIISLFPQKTFKDFKSELPAGSIDISKDNELMKELKSLGYIQ